MYAIVRTLVEGKTLETIFTTKVENSNCLLARSMRTNVLDLSSFRGDDRRECGPLARRTTVGFRSTHTVEFNRTISPGKSGPSRRS